MKHRGKQSQKDKPQRLSVHDGCRCKQEDSHRNALLQRREIECIKQKAEIEKYALYR